MVIRYPVACYASNCAVTINCYLKVTGTIVIAVYQTGDVACAVTATGNRCIAIGAVYVTQANIQRCLAYNRLAIAFQFQLIVFIQSCIVCCQSTAPGVIIVNIVRYLAAAYAINCAITSFVYCDCACVIAVSIYQTFDTACTVTATGNCCITVGAYYVVQAYLQGCLLNHGSTIINNQLIVLLQLVIRCSYIGIPLISIVSIVCYFAAAYSVNCAITGNSAYIYIADTIIIAVDITSQAVNAVACAINQRCITIGTLNIFQLNMHFCLANGNAASSFINKLIVAQLICIAGKRCMINLQAVIICASVRSVAPALIIRILSVSFIAYACAVLQAYLIAVDDAVILQTYIAVCFQAFLAAVFRAGINIVQVNLARQNIRYAMNCRRCAAHTIVLEFIIACKAIIKLNACLPSILSLIIGTLFNPNSNNTFIIVVLDFVLRISNIYLTI